MEACCGLVRAALEAGFSPSLETSISSSPQEVLLALGDMDSLTLASRKSDLQGVRPNSIMYHMCN